MTKPYRPANGTEGELFHEAFCYKCEHDRHESCEILAKTFVYSISDPEYPPEWVEDDVPFDVWSNPRCTAFLPLGEDAELQAARTDKRQLSLPL